MGDFTFQLGNFDPEHHPDDAWLLIEAGESHLAFISWHPSENRILALDYAQFPVARAGEAYHRILQAHPSVHMSWGKVRLLLFSREQVLLPDHMNQEGIGRHALNMVHGDLEPDGEMEDLITGTGIRNYYRLNPSARKILADAFPRAEYSHSFSALIACLARRADSLPASLMYVQVYHQQVALLVFMQQRLYLAQVFPYEIPEDISYYLLNTCEQLRMDPESLAMVVSGLLETGSPLYLELHKYFRHISTEAIPPGVSVPDDFNAFPTHFFTPQIMLAACE